MSRSVKTMVITALDRKLEGVRDFVIVDSSKLTAVEQQNLRSKLRPAQIRMLGIKNSLALQSLGKAGLNAAQIKPLLKGQSVMVFGGTDIVDLSKSVLAQAKEFKKMVVKGGVVEGAAVDSAQIESISTGPTREELIGKIVMLMLSPGANLAGALLGPGGTVCGQVKSKAEGAEDGAKSEEPKEGEAAATAAP